MIYDKDEDTPQWKMAIVQGRADDGDNDNNVLVDYVRDPYKQSGVAVSLRLENFGDDANDNKTWFRIDYHKANRMRITQLRERPVMILQSAAREPTGPRVTMATACSERLYGRSRAI